ncbi:hypothetical protein Syun_025898 [Stephania yunnanensis]|uniref:Uncharacterized protein n=1 Tax=Stephania yunnanensis TaxID=152371 RepID=A0AAP0EY07_9MAGN
MGEGEVVSFLPYVFFSVEKKAIFCYLVRWGWVQPQPHSIFEREMTYPSLEQPNLPISPDFHDQPLENNNTTMNSANKLTCESSPSPLHLGLFLLDELSLSLLSRSISIFLSLFDFKL